MSEAAVRIVKVAPMRQNRLRVSLSDGRSGIFDVSPYLGSDFFSALRSPNYFSQVHPIFDGYGIAWPDGQDLSADTVAHHLRLAKQDCPKKKRRIAQFKGFPVFLHYPSPPKRVPRLVVKHNRGEVEIAVISGRRLCGERPVNEGDRLKLWLDKCRKLLVSDGFVVQSGKAPSAVAPLRQDEIAH